MATKRATNEATAAAMTLREAARVLGRQGGLVKSPKKTAAVRRNGRLGGRSRRRRRGADANGPGVQTAIEERCPVAEVGDPVPHARPACVGARVRHRGGRRAAAE